MIVAIIGISLARRRRGAWRETYQEEGIGCECVQKNNSPCKTFQSHEARDECENDTIENYKPFDTGRSKRRDLPNEFVATEGKNVYELC
jgi:hypothetical protein